nr:MULTISPECIES: hypothetical protein [unclassified Bradyrhizobium]
MSAPATAFDQIDDGSGIVTAIGDQIAPWLDRFDEGRRHGLVR